MERTTRPCNDSMAARSALQSGQLERCASTVSMTSGSSSRSRSAPSSATTRSQGRRPPGRDPRHRAPPSRLRSLIPKCSILRLPAAGPGRPQTRVLFDGPAESASSQGPERVKLPAYLARTPGPNPPDTPSNPPGASSLRGTRDFSPPVPNNSGSPQSPGSAGPRSGSARAPSAAPPATRRPDS